MFDRRTLLTGGLAAALLPAAARAAGGAIEAPFRLTESHALMDVTLNGRGPYPFAIASGAAVSGVTRRVAAELGLKPVRQARTGSTSSPVYLVDELVFGGVIKQQKAALYGLPDRRIEAEGLLAAGMLTSMDSILDFERGVWSVYPNGSPDRTGFTALRSSLRSGGRAGAAVSERMYADARINGRGFRVVLDTGVETPLALSHGDGFQLGLLKDDLPWSPVAVGAGDGTYRPGRLVRGTEVQIGPAAYARPLMLVRPAGRFSADAAIGLPLLRTLDLSVDRSADAVWVRRNGLSPRLEAPYNYSGVWLDHDRSGIRVGEVGTGSPAAAAGVRPGDWLEGVTDLETGLEILRGPAGKPIELRLRRDGEAMTTRFELREYL